MTFPPPPAQKRQYNLLAAMALAPTASSALSRDVARNWRGIAARYLFVLMLITCTVTAIHIHLLARDWVRDSFPKLAEHFPPITITDGVVSSPVDQPYIIDDPKTHQPFFILDTTGQYVSLEKSPAVVLVTKNAIFTKVESGGEATSQDLSQIKSFFIDRAKLTRIVDFFSRAMVWILIPLITIGAFIFRLLQALIYALIGLAIASGFGARLTYASLVRLSILSVTPVIILDTILEFTTAAVPLWTVLIAVAIAMFYLTMAIRANADNAPPTYVYEPPYVPPGM